MERETTSGRTFRWKRQTIAVLLFGISFGYVEAAVVTYLRPQFYAVRTTFTRPSHDPLPMLSAQQVRAVGPDMGRTVRTEVGREAATLLMLGAVAAAVGGSMARWLAFFLLAFGAWDISYYAFLKVLIDWPKSLLTWDVLFLIPVPWSGPVLAAGLVALTMVGTALVYLWRESKYDLLGLRAVHWLGVGVGALLILAAFTRDFRNVMAGGMPKPFAWPLFALGEILWVWAFLHGMSTTGPSHSGRTRIRP